MSEFAKLRPILQHLSVNDLERVIKECEFLLSEKAPNEADWILDGITNELYRRGLYPRPSLAFQKKKQYAAKAADVARLYLARFKHKPSATELVALGHLFARCLVDCLSSRFNERGPGKKFPLTLELMLSKISDIPAAVDESFPNYPPAFLLGVAQMRPQSVDDEPRPDEIMPLRPDVDDVDQIRRLKGEPEDDEKTRNNKLRKRILGMLDDRWDPEQIAEELEIEEDQVWQAIRWRKASRAQS